jgi:hypothetical protein
VATLANLADRVRIELGDLGKSFVTNFVADGTTNRFRLHYAPLDGNGVKVFKNGTDISDLSSVEEQTGILVLDTVPAEGDEILVSGTYYRYFTATEINSIVQEAFQTHAYNHTDSVGRALTIDNLPGVEEYPVAIHAVTLALYTLATDAAFDIDIQAPDGVSIPRSERYRQLMEMVQTRQNQYRELCSLLGIGLYKMDVFDLNRISKATGRLIPKYTPQEVDDRSYPQRVHTPAPTLGSTAEPWPTEAGELTAYQGRAYQEALTFIGNYSGKTFIANLLNQRGSVLTVQALTLNVTTSGTDVITAASRTSGSTTITLTTSAAHGLAQGDAVAITGVDSTVNGFGTVASVVDTTHFTITGLATTALSLTNITGQAETNASKAYTFNLSLTKDQTLRLAERTYWSISTIDAFTSEQVEIKGGNFFTVRSSTVVL